MISRYTRILVGCVGALLAAFGAMTTQAQVAALQVSCKEPVINEFGQALPNDQGALVQFIDVTGGIQPPALNGLPQGSNTVIFTTRVGNGVSRSALMAGRFSAGVTPRPTGPVIARVFNQSSLESSSFYVDSQSYTALVDAVFYPKFTNAMTALDAADDDGDGLNNSLEKSLGSNSQLLDSDGDGYDDHTEFLAGTSPADGHSFLRLSGLQMGKDGLVNAEWAAISGRTYRLQVLSGDLENGQWVDESSSTTTTLRASSAIGRMAVPNDAASPQKYYRLLLQP